MKKKLFPLLTAALLLVLVIIALPDTAAADYSDGEECWLCGHYHWDDYMCDCGACSIDCTNDSCFVDSHCNECGACFLDVVFCEECMLCESCYVDLGYHCLACEECYFGEEDSLCGDCYFCNSCMDVCDECGFCDSCWEVDKVHCLECGNCYSSYAMCENGAEHCEECCELCEQCGECTFENDDKVICENCGLCAECCLENAESEGCSCGELCVESSDWEDHFCDDCGICFDEAEQCEECGLCLDCCESLSDCPEGLCIYSSEYDDHFCEDCGECFDSVDRCEDCDELRCKDCCRMLVEDAGCDGSCGEELCISDPDLEDHIRSVHNVQFGTDHVKANPQTGWSFDASAHWHGCKNCDEASHNTAKASHTYDSNGRCTVCGYIRGGSVFIQRQPKDYSCKVTDCNASYGEPYNSFDNLAHFSVKAVGIGELSYQWQTKMASGWTDVTDHSDSVKLQQGLVSYDLAKGAKTGSLAVLIPTDACVSDYSYRCKISDKQGHVVYSDVVKIAAAHLYNANSGYGCVSTVDSSVSNLFIQESSSRIYSFQIYASAGHQVQCAGEDCEMLQSERVLPHEFGGWVDVPGTDKSGESYRKRSCKYCDYTQLNVTHDHFYYDKNGFPEVDYTYKNQNWHQLICLYPGCEETHREYHDWMGWTAVGYPGAGTNGAVYRECRICSYSQDNFHKDASGKRPAWTLSSNLISVEFGRSSKDVVQSGDVLTLTVTVPEDRVKDYENRKVDGWQVHYISADGTKLTDVTKLFNMKEADGALVWETTVPSGVPFGGTLEFEPEFDDCTHNHGTVLRNAYSAYCTRAGYTGDEVCKDCAKVVKEGKSIPAPGTHGTLTLIPGTQKTGSCTEYGYTGDFKCSACKKTVKGDRTPKVHTNIVTTGYIAPTCTQPGFSGVQTCKGCGKEISSGKILAAEHSAFVVKNAVAPTEQAAGYSGDTYCGKCGVLVKEGHVMAKINPNAGAKTPFTDVSESDYFYKAVVWAYNAKPQITDGNGKDKFMPEQICTRGQVVTFLWRSAGCPEPKTTKNPFTDVKTGDYFYKPVLWAVENGITDGTAPDKFSPAVTCRNSHILTFIWRAMGEPSKTGQGTWYTDAYNWASKSGMLKDTYTGTYDINGQCPRKNVVQYLYNYYKMK